VKKLCFIILIMVLTLSHVVYGEGQATRNWVIDRGYFGVGGLNLGDKINRASFATVAIRLMDLEGEALEFDGDPAFGDIEDFQGGWASSIISTARNEGLMSGRSKDRFDPGGNVSYVEMLTVFLRILGYEDGVDFVEYPDDYLKKALEIGLGDMYIQQDEEVTRKTVLDTMIRALNTPMKSEDSTLFDKLDPVEVNRAGTSPVDKVSMENLKFTTSVVGSFSGNLKGSLDFTGYRIVLLGKDGKIYGSKVLGKDGKIYGSKVLGKDGKFSISGFDVGVLARMSGYKYEVYGKDGKLILSGNLK